MTKYSDDELLSIAVGCVGNNLRKFEGINDPAVAKYRNQLEQCLVLLRKIKGEGVEHD